SLLPQHIRRAKMWQEKTKWFAAAAAMVVLGTGLAYGALYARQEIPYNAAEEERVKLASLLSTATNLDRQWAEIEQSGAGDRTQIANISSLLQYRDLYPSLISDIYRALPKPAGNADPASLPRGDRTAIFIERISFDYQNDMAELLSKSDEEFIATAAGGNSSRPGAPR